jgi:hypothetical protein
MSVDRGLYEVEGEVMEDEGRSWVKRIFSVEISMRKMGGLGYKG